MMPVSTMWSCCVCAVFVVVYCFGSSEPTMNLSHGKGSTSSSPLKAGDTVSDQFPAGLRVLVVDDDPTCLMILERMLRACLYEGAYSLSLSKINWWYKKNVIYFVFSMFMCCYGYYLSITKCVLYGVFYSEHVVWCSVYCKFGFLQPSIYLFKLMLFGMVEYWIAWHEVIDVVSFYLVMTDLFVYWFFSNLWNWF